VKASAGLIMEGRAASPGSYQEGPAHRNHGGPGAPARLVARTGCNVVRALYARPGGRSQADLQRRASVLACLPRRESPLGDSAARHNL